MKFIIPQRYIDEELIIKKKHDSLDLYIYNYAPRVQFERLWDTYTMACRGLILDGDNNIIARPPIKFFNFDEVPEGIRSSIIDGPFDCTEKVDGSMLILTRHHGQLIFATRGSFSSDQCAEAKKIWNEYYYQLEYFIKEGWTYVFEIIYPENRIVVDYGGYRKLIALEYRCNSSDDFFYFPEGLGFDVVKHYSFKSIGDLLSNVPDVWTNEEGYVVRFKNGIRIKIKTPEYFRLHKLLTNLNDKDIWESLSSGNDFDLNSIPDEFYNWYKSVEIELIGIYNSILEKANKALINLKPVLKRKEQANIIKEHYDDIKTLLFLMLDNKKTEQQLWKLTWRKYEQTSQCSRTWSGRRIADAHDAG